MRAAAKVQSAAVVEGLGVAAGEVAAELRCQAIAGESDAADAAAAGRRASWTGKKTFWYSESWVGKSIYWTALAQELVVVRERKIMHFTKCALLMQDLLPPNGTCD